MADRSNRTTHFFRTPREFQDFRKGLRWRKVNEEMYVDTSQATWRVRVLNNGESVVAQKDLAGPEDRKLTPSQVRAHRFKSFRSYIRLLVPSLFFVALCLAAGYGFYYLYVKG